MSTYEFVNVKGSATAILGDIFGGLQVHLHVHDTEAASNILSLLPARTGFVNQINLLRSPSSLFLYEGDPVIEQSCQAFDNLDIDTRASRRTRRYNDGAITPIARHVRGILSERPTPTPKAISDPDRYRAVHRFMSNIDAYVACSYAEHWVKDSFAPLSLSFNSVLVRKPPYRGLTHPNRIRQRCHRYWSEKEKISVGSPSLTVLISILAFLFDVCWLDCEDIQVLAWVSLYEASEAQLGIYHPLTRLLEQCDPRRASDLCCSVPPYQVSQRQIMRSSWKTKLRCLYAVFWDGETIANTTLICRTYA